MTESTGLQGALIAVCNPLLDITATVDKEFLAKWGLKENDAILAEEKHSRLFEEIKEKYNVVYSAGGAGQNTARAAQWLLPKGTTVYIGCVGKDENGQILRSAAEGDGLIVEYMEENNGSPTGTCAVLLTGKHRSLVAELGAASKYKRDHFLSEAVQSHIDHARLIYITGFFLTTSPETIIHLATIAHEHGKDFAMNLSAPFLSHACKGPLLDALPFVDFLFGNEAEAAAFAEANGLCSTDAEDVARILADWPQARSGKGRTVIITQGADPTIVARSGEPNVQLFHTPAIKPEEIVDTNGAGDAFVGGFLSQFIQQKSLQECIDMGHKLAGFIIRQSGVQFPKECPPGFLCRPSQK